MKFTLLAHPTFGGANEMLYSRLEKADPADLSVKHIVLVPDRNTLAAEKEILSRFGGSFSLQVYTMRRFSSLILPEFRYLDKQSGILALTKIVSDTQKDLTCFKGRPSYGFISDLYDVIKQLKYSRITPDRLKTDKLPYYLKAKTEDIRKIYMDYEAFLSSGFADSADRLESLARAIPYSRVVSESHFYIKDFDNFSIQETEIISRLAQFGLSFTAAVTFCDLPSHSMLYLNDAYKSVLSTMKKLIERGVIDESMTQTVIDRTMTDRQSFIFSALMNAGIANVKPRPLPESMEVYSACSVTDEVNALVGYIAEGVANGDKYSDFTVAVSDTAKYSSALKDAFTECEIPFFIDEKLRLSEHAACRFILNYYSMYADGFSLRSVVSFVKNDFFDALATDKFAFEIYVRRYNQAHRFHSPFTFAQDDEYFASAQGIREKLASIAPIEGNSIQKAELFIENAQKLIEDTQLFERLESFGERQRDAGLKEQAAYTAQVSAKLTQLLSVMKNTLAGLEISVDLFAALLEHAMSATEISVLPLNNHCVELIELPKARRHDYKRLCVLGANEGVFPVVKGDFGILSDDNLSSLAQAGINIEPSVRTLNQRERFNVFQLLTESYDSLYMSYCAGEKGENKPAMAVKHFMRMFTERGERLVPESRLTKQERAVLTPIRAKRYLLERVCAYADGHSVRLADVSSLYYALGAPSEQSLRKRFAPLRISKGRELLSGEGNMSVSRIETYYICPFRHFLQYGMKLRKPENDARAQDFGSIIHSVAEGFMRPYSNPSFVETDSRAEARTDTLFDRIVDSNDFYKALLVRADMRAVFARLKEECRTIMKELKRQLAISDFRPLMLEKRFDQLSPIKIPTKVGDICLRGVIDRVDAYGNDVIIIDYKTGSADFGYNDFYMGKKLQLPVYKQAIEQTGYRCVGFYYMRLSGGYIRKSDNKRFMLLGRTLKDNNVISAIDKQTYQLGKSSRLGFRLNSSGEPYASFKGLASQELLDSIDKYTLILLDRAACGFVEGNAEALPIKDECRYCDYKEICDFGDVIVGQPRQANVTAEDILAAVEKEQAKRVEDNGHGI